MNCFCSRLKELRIEAGLSRADLAKKLNISVRSISYWESGKRECSFNMLIAIANLFEISVDYLLGRTDF